MFHNYSMYEPLTDDMIPNELLIADEGVYSVFHLACGKDISEFVNIVDAGNAEASYSVMNGTLQITMQIDGYSVKCIISGEGMNLPAEDTAHEYDWKEWAEAYLRNPTGIIFQIRVAQIP